MLVVNDLEKLSKYGFTNEHFNIYKKVLYADEYDNEISLLVNTVDDDTGNILALYYDLIGTFEEEINDIVTIDIIYDMIKDGVVSKI